MSAPRNPEGFFRDIRRSACSRSHVSSDAASWEKNLDLSLKRYATKVNLRVCREPFFAKMAPFGRMLIQCDEQEAISGGAMNEFFAFHTPSLLTGGVGANQ